MKVSSHSLFHYTPQFDNLFSIISQGLRFSHNVDEMPLRGLEGDIFVNLGVVRSEWHSDIICFCDIPLSASFEHRTQYGDYVLGLTKDWATFNAVTPIRYVHKDSPDYRSRYPDWVLALSQFYEAHGRDAVAMLRQYWTEAAPITPPSDAELEQLPPSVKRLLVELNGLFQSLLFPAFNNFHLIKMHKGNWTDRKSGVEAERYFYDEREWRAIGRRGEHLRFSLEHLTRVILTNDTERQTLFREIEESNPALPQEEERRIYSIIVTWDELLREG